ncbi:MAG: Helix-turn-helix domain protein [Pelotomaculum sp. PtaB.Bin104]|nr:MAG: Helix-turn-helix domain protein [Pelotomaculum sp. PtaB.Bin104]
MRPEIKRKFYKVEEVAAIIGMSRSGTYAAVKAGAIPVVRVGRRILVPESAINNLENIACTTVQG